MKLLVIVGLFAALAPLAAQAPKAEIRLGTSPPPNHGVLQSGTAPNRATAVSTPLLGFITGPGPLQLTAILGTFANAHLSHPIAPPSTAARFFLAPGQRYALVEQNSEQPIAVWALDRPALTSPVNVALPISHAASHPDLIVFSPTGNTAVLYSRSLDRIQVVSGLPLRPMLSRESAAPSLGTLTMMAVSDDATSLVAKNSAGQAEVVLNGGTWRILPGVLSASAWSFVPKTHDLVISESEQNAITLLHEVDNPLASGTPVTIASGLHADRLAVTRDAQTVVGFSSRQGLLWAVALKTGVVTPIDSSHTIDLLKTLRDGDTFLVSSTPVPPILIVNVPDSSHASIGVIHPQIASTVYEGATQ